MINPYYFTHLKVGFTINLDSLDINHANSKIFITPNNLENGSEVRYNEKNIRKLSVIYAKSLIQYNFKYQTVLSTRFDKQDEDNQVLDETEIFII